jgi:hypothetical protein
VTPWREPIFARWFPVAHSARCAAAATAVSVLPLVLSDSACSAQVLFTSAPTVATAFILLWLRPHRVPARRAIQCCLVCGGAILNLLVFGLVLADAQGDAIRDVLAATDAYFACWVGAAVVMRVAAGPCAKGDLAPEDIRVAEPEPSAPSPRRAGLQRPAGDGKIAGGLSWVALPEPPEQPGAPVLRRSSFPTAEPTPRVQDRTPVPRWNSRAEPAWFRNGVGDYVGPRSPPQVVGKSASQASVLMLPLEWGWPSRPTLHDPDPDL